MKSPIFKLESIFTQASNSNLSEQFFTLLHEFALELQNPKFQEALKIIKATESKQNKWINQMSHGPSSELRSLYSSQYRKVSTWFSLNQIMVFFERYDFAFHDTLVQKLTKNNIDAAQLQNEHSEMMKYVITGVCPKIFPTIDEYKQYMRRIINSLDESLVGLSSLTTYPFSFDKKSNILLIEACAPIKFTRNKNPSLVMGFLDEKKWKSVNWNDIFENFGLEPNAIKRTLRHINDQIPDHLPPFLITSDHPAKLNEKIVTPSSLYKNN